MAGKRELISRKSLSSEEQVVFETRRSAWLSMKSAVLAMVLFVVAVILFIWSQISSAPSIPGLSDAWKNASYGRYVQGALLVIAIALLVFIAYKYLKWGATVYAATNERIITKTGILSKNFEDMPLRMITNIDLDQSIGNRAMGYGTILFSTQGMGGKKADVVWTGVPHPMDVRRTLQEALDSRFRGRASEDRDAPPAPAPAQAPPRKD